MPCPCNHASISAIGAFPLLPVVVLVRHSRVAAARSGRGGRSFGHAQMSSLPARVRTLPLFAAARLAVSGLAMSELVLEGESSSINLRAFSPRRFDTLTYRTLMKQRGRQRKGRQLGEQW